MKIGKLKLDAGRYRITANGRATSLVAAKGDPPKFGMRQGWDLGVETEGEVTWIAYDLPSLDAVLQAVATIKDA